MTTSISKRLREIARFVTEENILADVGTDHGYVPIYLVKNKKISHAIAMDVRKGPLEKAKENIQKEHLEDKIETRLSDGLQKLKEKEAETILIAGMGGSLVIKILTEGNTVAKTAKELVLSPQSEIAQVRHFLEEHGYKVIAEKTIYEEEKYYTVMKAVNGCDQYKEECFYSYGKVEVQEDIETYLRYLHAELEKMTSIEEKLYKAGQEQANVQARIEEIKEKKQQLLKVIECAKEAKK